MVQTMPRRAERTRTRTSIVDCDIHPAPASNETLLNYLPARCHHRFKVYGARGVVFTANAEKDLRRARALGYDRLPVCMAKTQLSLSDDPTKVGRPSGFDITVREVRIAAGAGFLVPLTGEMMTMPGLPRVPAARGVKLLADGRIRGLMQND